MWCLSTTNLSGRSPSVKPHIWKSVCHFTEQANRNRKEDPIYSRRTDLSDNLLTQVDGSIFLLHHLLTLHWLAIVLQMEMRAPVVSGGLVLHSRRANLCAVSGYAQSRACRWLPRIGSALCSQDCPPRAARDAEGHLWLRPRASVGHSQPFVGAGPEGGGTVTTLSPLLGHPCFSSPAFWAGFSHSFLLCVFVFIHEFF